MSFETRTELGTESLTLIERPPGLGLVAAIAVDQITTQLDLEQHGTIVSDDFPPVAAFDDGRVRDAVRVYAGEDPSQRGRSFSSNCRTLTDSPVRSYTTYRRKPTTSVVWRTSTAGAVQYLVEGARSHAGDVSEVGWGR